MKNGKLQIGIIGCGGIANTKHFPSLKENADKADLVAFCDLIEERAIKGAEEYGVPGAKVYTDYKELLKDPEIDLVHVLTPNVAHCQITVDAFEAGKHVLCEKPMAATPEDAQKMMDAWKKSGKQFTIGSESIMGSMIELCGGKNLGYREGVDRWGSSAEIVNILESNPDAVVFVNDTYFSSGKTIQDFRDEVLGGDQSIRVVAMDSQWNNCCPESVDGLVAVSQCLYPEIFGEYDTGEESGDDGSDFPITYVAIGIIVVIAIVAVAVVLMRRKP